MKTSLSANGPMNHLLQIGMSSELKTHQILISVQQVLLGHKSIGFLTQPSETQIRLTYVCMSDKSAQGYVHISHAITGQIHARVEMC